MEGMIEVQQIALTVDVEVWKTGLRSSTIGVKKLLNLFETTGVKGTFFVTGHFAELAPHIVHEIHSSKHEIACHGYQDTALPKNNSSELRRQLTHTTKALYNILGQRPIGFRAPKCSMTSSALEILGELGYIYDSSIHPTFIPGKYNYLRFPTQPYHPSKTDLSRKGCMKILEIPISVFPLLKIPISWWWMRNMGVWWTIFATRSLLNKGYPVVFYIHPWELIQIPRVQGISWSYRRKTGDQTYYMLKKYIISFRNQAHYVTLRQLAEGGNYVC